MFSRIRNINKLFITAFVPGFTRNKEDDVGTSKTAQIMEEELKKQPTTGMDRLYLMLSKDEFGEPSPEIINMYQVTASSFIIGIIIGGFIHSKSAFLNFVERNDASTFSSHLEAKQKLQDKVTTGFAKGGWQWGWRLALFTFTYTGISSTISVYRGKDGILEHVAAGCVTGALYKVNLGLRGIVVGGALGTVLGTFCGVSIWGILKLTGLTVQDIRHHGHSLNKNRDDSYRGLIEQYQNAKELEIVLEHDKKVGHKEVTLDSIKS